MIKGLSSRLPISKDRMIHSFNNHNNFLINRCRKGQLRLPSPPSGSATLILLLHKSRRAVFAICNLKEFAAVRFQVWGWNYMHLRQFATRPLFPWIPVNKTHWLCSPSVLSSNKSTSFQEVDWFLQKNKNKKPKQIPELQTGFKLIKHVCYKHGPICFGYGGNIRTDLQRSWWFHQLWLHLVRKLLVF